MHREREQVAPHLPVSKVVPERVVPVAVVQGGPSVKLEPFRAGILHDQERVMVQPVARADEFVEVRHEFWMREDGTERIGVGRVPPEETREILAAGLAVAR